jgi:superfamily II DNA/RNA helicase
VYVAAVQGDMPFEDRDRVVNEFRRGETKILISTDVLARGFDVSQVRHRTHAAVCLSAAVQDVLFHMGQHNRLAS